MTYASAAKPLLGRFETYLAGVFHPVPQERVIAGAIQSFYGWFFAFLRNAFICGVLQYLADASGALRFRYSRSSPMSRWRLIACRTSMYGC
jgi:hypothetical protein